MTALGTGLVGGWVNAWTAQTGYPAQVAALIRTEGGTARGAGELERIGHDLTLRAPTPTVTLEGPDGPREVALHPGGTGRFVGRLEVPGAGGYSTPDAALGLPLPVSDPALLARVAAATGGRLLETPTLPAAPGGGWAWYPAWPTFALLALLTFLMGLTFRYWPEGQRPSPG